MNSEAPLPSADLSASSGAGLYIHVPFCTSVCPYCDFAVLIAGDERRALWAGSVVREAAMYADRGLCFDTVYLGGGTPSCLAPDRLGEIFRGVGGNLEILPEAQLYLEANPEDVVPTTVAAWRSLGVHTVSLGVQSFDDVALRFLGRKHTAADARRAAEVLLESGFHTVSVDLIFGLDGQTASSWRAQLEEAVALGVDHLSCYQLTIHEGTIFGRRFEEGHIRELGATAQAELFLLTHELLADAGYEGYEVSSFARGPEHRSHHNRKYWDHTPYLGLGPSAHSFVDGRRWWNRRKLRLWQSALNEGRRPIEGEEELTRDQLLLETVMLSLRTSDGIDVAAVDEQFGHDLLGVNAAVVERWSNSGHLCVEKGRIRPTVRGLAIADAIARSFVL